jgi:hypothetical protein
MRMNLLLSAVCVLGAATPAYAEKITIDEDTFFTIGTLLQPQFQIIEDGSPDEGVGTDFFLRRARLVLTGWFDQHIGFVFVTDQANFGKNGDFSTQFIVQDAVASYKFGPELTISAGFMLLPFTRNDFQSAGALNAIDFRAGVIKFLPTGRAFRDMGVEVRGLIAQEKIYYRAGVFSGLAGKAATETTPEVNAKDVPRLTGHLRYNLLGKEDAYAFSGIYFATDPIVSVGVGVDWQMDALDSPDADRYLAMAVDVYADYPVNPDLEVVAQAAVIRYDGYPVGTGRDVGTAFFAEGGVRIQKVEPTASIEYFDGDIEGSRVITARGGLNYFIAKHNYNIKAEVAVPFVEENAAGVEPPSPIVGTVQAQLSF